MVARRSDVFVGRARELEHLERALETTRAGHGASVLVSGDAGIGKTRLATELGQRAREAGFDVLLGRSIDLVGTELPYQPFVEALRPLGEPWRVDAGNAGSQRHLFEETLAVLSVRAASTPVLLVLEDLHWADTSTLDLVVFLAHNLDDRRLLLLGTYRADEPESIDRMHRLAAGVRRAGSQLVVDLGPLDVEAIAALLAAHADTPLSPALADAIVVRSEGNPLFAEELIAAAGDPDSGLPTGLRTLLLRRVARLDRPTQSLLRLAAAAGRDIGYHLLRETAQVPEGDVRESLRRAVEHGVLVSDQAESSFHFRHALLAEAIYATILPGEREELHARLAAALTRSGAAAPGELAPHWAAAHRSAEALATSVQAARQAEAVCGLAEARGHLERALALWHAVPDADELTGLDLAALCTWSAGLAGEVGAAARAVELTQQAIELVGGDDAHRAALLHVRLGEYLHATGGSDAHLAALERAVELVPAEPPSRERAYALGSLAGGLMVAWRHLESLSIAEQALALARAVDAGDAEVRALTVLAGDLAYLGRADDGVARFRQALQLAEAIGDRIGLERAYVNFTDALTMLGRPRESARVGQSGLELTRRYGIESALLVSNQIEALFAIGDWAEAERLSAAALRGVNSSFEYALSTIRADVEIGRGEFDAARAHLDAVATMVGEDRVGGLYDASLAELALWERRWMDACDAVEAGLAQARRRETAQVRVRLCAKGLRAHAELGMLARARRDADRVRDWLARAEKLIGGARSGAAEASAITPNADGWLAIAEAEYGRVRATPEPERWSAAAETWDRLERAPLAAYCRWRQAEALVASGSSRTEASAPLRAAQAVAARTGAAPLLAELELLARRARLDLAEPPSTTRDGQHGIAAVLGLTAREGEVLGLVARGYTNREIAATLVISAKTASVHVSHILQKLGASNRQEAAAIAHRLAPPPGSES